MRVFTKLLHACVTAAPALATCYLPFRIPSSGATSLLRGRRIDHVKQVIERRKRAWQMKRVRRRLTKDSAWRPLIVLTMGGLLFFAAAAARDASANEPAVADASTSQAFNVRDYGAVGDDATDNTAAFSACLQAVIEAGGGRVFIPDGIYRGRIIIPGTTAWITVEIIGASEPTPVWGTIGASATPEEAVEK